MTSPRTAPRTDDAEAPPRPKATLFCPDCGHENPLQGDWIVSPRCDGGLLVCPDCGATVTTCATVPVACPP
ncbi:hypothetical protein BRC92_03930 [Halobacteriales archaeon QS_4_69_31]|nr:MAG: hypothetical protein BRC92_03930 [Halobacteriales archaeon QS_4_69_31]